MNNNKAQIVFSLLLLASLISISACSNKTKLKESQIEKVVTRNFRNNDIKFINVKDFGAKGNGKTNDTKIIQSANDQAARLGKELYFPEGVYLCNNLKASTSWTGTKKTIIKSNGLERLLWIHKQNNLRFEGLRFEGKLSSDPLSWGKNNYDNFEGNNVIFISQSKNIQIRNCTLVNANNAVIKTDLSKHIKIENCTIKKARGKFGDGVYFSRSKNVSLINTNISDCTRHGVVFEKQSDIILLDSCLVRNTHHASRNFGDLPGQLNSGFWIENSGNINIENCKAENNPDFGFVISTAKFNEEHADIQLSNSEVQNSKIAFNIASSSNCSVLAKILNCNSNSTIRTNSKNPVDNFLIEHCHIDFTHEPDAKNNVAFMWEQSSAYKTKELPKITYQNCSIRHLNYLRNSVASTKTNNADFSCYQCGSAEISILNCHSTSGENYLSLKSRTGVCNFNIVNTAIEPLYLKKGTRLSLNNSKLGGNFVKRMYDSKDYTLIIEGKTND